MVDKIPANDYLVWNIGHIDNAPEHRGLVPLATVKKGSNFCVDDNALLVVPMQEEDAEVLLQAASHGGTTLDGAKLLCRVRREQEIRELMERAIEVYKQYAAA